MKIAVIGSKGLPAKQGGIERYCAELYPRIVAKGHQVDFFARTSYTDCSWFETYDYEGVRVISLPSLPLKGIDAFFCSAISALATCLSRYDVIHFHALGPALFTLIPRILAFASPKKIVVTCQGLDWQRAKWGNLSSSIIRMGERMAVFCADDIMVVSKALENYFQETYQLETTYSPNAPGRFAEPDQAFSYGHSLGLEKGKYFVFLGRLVPEKCPDLLVKAFLSLQHEDWKLVLVGGNSDTNEFTTQLLEMAEGNPNIIFTGELRGKRLAEIVKSAGVFTLPSDLEGLPLAMLEAMNEGVPVLASDIAPHKQLIGMNNKRGVLFKAGDEDACTQALDWAIHHPKELQAMADEARNNVRLNYNWELITEQNLMVYGEIPVSKESSNLQEETALISD